MPSFLWRVEIQVPIYPIKGKRPRIIHKSVTFNKNYKLRSRKVTLQKKKLGRFRGSLYAPSSHPPLAPFSSLKACQLADGSQRRTYERRTVSRGMCFYLVFAWTCCFTTYYYMFLQRNVCHYVSMFVNVM